ncbi:MAG: hypothetical protein ACD_62C00293G0016 [uncultured bacterium]|nr:MAG: hypothetical protein ACD_62C00293G0016 [uncultured bacterium]
MKKILFINYEYPPLGGGGGNATEQIAQILAQKGFDVSVCTSRYRGLRKCETVKGVRILRLPTLRRHLEKCSVFEMVVFVLSSLWHMVPIFFRTRPDRVICFFSIPCGPAALLLKLLFGVPYIVALRGGDVPGFLPEQLARIHKVSNWLTRLVWRFSDGLTTNSQGLAALAKAFYDRKNINVIPNGVDAQYYRDHQRTQNQDRLTILTVGRLSVQKHVERLIDSIQRLVSSGQNRIFLKIAGEGPERARLEALVGEDEKLKRQVIFLGWRDREQLVQDYHTADVFALTSDFEGMPNVILEAMAASLAIVATPAPGTVDLVFPGENGFLIPYDQLEKLDESFLFLLRDRVLLAKMQDKSCLMAREYTWEKVVDAYVDLCEGRNN